MGKGGCQGSGLRWGKVLPQAGSFPQSAHSRDGAVVVWHPLPQDPPAPPALGLRGLQSDRSEWYHHHYPLGCRVLGHEPTLSFISSEAGLGPRAPFPRAGSPPHASSREGWVLLGAMRLCCL